MASDSDQPPPFPAKKNMCLARPSTGPGPIPPKQGQRPGTYHENL